MQQTKQTEIRGRRAVFPDFRLSYRGRKVQKSPLCILRTQKRDFLVVDFCISLGENGTVIQTPVRKKSSWKCCFRENQPIREDQKAF